MEGGIDEKWAAVSGALTESADALLGKVGQGKAGWFRESMSTLNLYFKAETARTPNGWPQGRKRIWQGSSR